MNENTSYPVEANFVLHITYNNDITDTFFTYDKPYHARGALCFCVVGDELTTYVEFGNIKGYQAHNLREKE